jgi:hypothetical protein
MATVLMHIQEPIPRPGRFNPNLSPAVEKVILKAMAKNPEDRFPTVAAMNQAYQAAVRGAPQTEADWLQLRSPGEVAVARQMTHPSDGEAAGGRRSPIVWLLAGVALALAVTGVVGAAALSSLAGASPTPALPTVVAAATSAPSAESTATSVATATIVVSSECPNLSLIGFRNEGAEVTWAIYNGGQAVVRITGLQVVSPEDNVPETVSVGDVTLPVEGFAAALPPEKARIAAGAVLPLGLQFPYADSQGPYRLVLSLDSTCSLTTSW